MQITHFLPKTIDENADKWDALGEDNLKLIHFTKSELELRKEGLDDEGEFIALPLFFLVVSHPHPSFALFQMICVLMVMMTMMN
jgi:hypothetical protein